MRVCCSLLLVVEFSPSIITEGMYRYKCNAIPSLTFYFDLLLQLLVPSTPFSLPAIICAHTVCLPLVCNILTNVSTSLPPPHFTRICLLPVHLTTSLGKNNRFHTWIGHKDKKWTMRYPCGGYPPGPVTKMKAGQVIDVRFYASAMKSNDLKKQPKLSKSTKQFAQARHGGGMCEFSLSYDGGKSYRLIGRYSKTCPDSYYTWPVRIPKNAKSCTKKNQCLFVWTWTAAVVPQFYMNCADIQLSGAKNGVYPPRKGIQVYNIKGHKKKVFPGDGQKHKAGPGPNKKEINNNMNDRF